MTRRLTVAAFTAATLLAACGGSSASTTAAAPTTAAAAPTAAAATATTVGGAGTGAGADQRAALQAWQECLTKNGVTLPSIPAGGGGGRRNGGTGTTVAGAPTSAAQAPADGQGDGQGGGGPGGRGGFGGLGQILQDPANQAAVQACASLQPQGGFGQGGGGNGQRGQALQAYLSCMKDHGLEVPTTVAGGGPPASIDRNAPGFAAAQEVCQALLPQRQNGSTTTTVAA